MSEETDHRLEHGAQGQEEFRELLVSGGLSWKPFGGRDVGGESKNPGFRYTKTARGALYGMRSR